MGGTFRDTITSHGHETIKGLDDSVSCIHEFVAERWR